MSSNLLESIETARRARCPGEVPFEITTRWDDTLLEVSHIEGSFALCDVALIVDGALVAPSSGRIALIDYEIRAVARPTRALPLARTDDRRVVPYVAATLALHLALWGAATRGPAEPTAHVAIERKLRAATISHAFSDARAELPDVVTTDRAHDTKGNGRAAAARATEGLAGAPLASRERGHVATANTGEEPQLAKTAQIEQARHAGILGSAKVLDEQFRSLTGDDKLTSGFDDRHDVTASFDGGDGASRGSFGTGRGGVGTGGDGLYTMGSGGSRGSFSVGTTRGHAWGGSLAMPTERTWASTWNGTYEHAYHSISHLGSPVKVTICGAPYRERCRVTGDLDPAIVRRYVKRQVGRLSYCYEKQLLANRELAVGAVFVDFAIDPDGHVEGATATELDPTVASCVHDVFAQLEFPAAGMTHVEYALVFAK